MIDKPDLPDSVLVDVLREGWNLSVTGIDFMPLGLDRGAWSYDVRASSGRFFLKVRAGGYDPAAISVPRYLVDHGLAQVVAPLGDVRPVGDLRLALYPFVDGADLWSCGLTDTQWTAYGRFLGALHTVTLPAPIAALVPTEAYASTASDRLRALAGPAAAAPTLGPLWRRHGADLLALGDDVDRWERHAAEDPRPNVLCHGDVHPANLLAAGVDDLRVVDWDAPIRAPRERDLMFVFGTDYGAHPMNAHREELFRHGYGPLGPDDALLRYYRHERRLDDIALFMATVLDESVTEASRRQELELLMRILDQPH